jgi:CubicO group peptidase (beta-lactamase class C family)
LPGKLITAALLSAWAATALSAAVGAQAPSAATIDAIFAHMQPSEPGCAVGVEAAGQPPVLRTYGSADLEHPVPIAMDTVFEAGSVSKQFTAAAALVLVDEHRLSLDDDVRKYLPELPDYGQPITIAELMGHTSGLRDWEEIAAIAGWPYGERVYGQDDVLQIAARQHALNFNPGTAWSYTNTGYNLLALVIQRISGSSLAKFSREHLFTPLGMTHTQWRDDFRRVVPGRAVAYVSTADGNYEQYMPIGDTYGHGGLLTTVGDLLIWNRALDERRLGAFVTDELQRPTRLTDGREVTYAKGLFVHTYRGGLEIFHDGATAGYRAWLGRFLEPKLSIAILCNSDKAYSSNLPRTLADLYLPAAVPAASPSAAAPETLAGWYANEGNALPLYLLVRDGRLQTSTGLLVQSGSHGALALLRPDGRTASTGVALTNGSLSFNSEGDTRIYLRQGDYKPTIEELSRLSGRYHSGEADATYQVTATALGLRVKVEGRADSERLYLPIYSNAFMVASTTFDDEDRVLRPVFTATGAVTAIRISNERVWDLRVERVGPDVMK